MLDNLKVQINYDIQNAGILVILTEYIMLYGFYLLFSLLSLLLLLLQYLSRGLG